MDNYQEWIQLVAQYTVQSLKAWQWASGSIHYLLGLWSRLVSSAAYLKGDAPSLLDNFAPKIIEAYVSSRCASLNPRGSSIAAVDEAPQRRPQAVGMVTRLLCGAVKLTVHGVSSRCKLRGVGFARRVFHASPLLSDSESGLADPSRQAAILLLLPACWTTLRPRSLRPTSPPGVHTAHGQHRSSIGLSEGCHRLVMASDIALSRVSYCCHPQPAGQLRAQDHRGLRLFQVRLLQLHGQSQRC